MVSLSPDPLPLTPLPGTLLGTLVEFRDYQQDLLAKMYQILAGSPVARVMVQLPTGGGKTCIAGELLSGCLNGGRKAVWLTHRSELATQTEGMLHEAGVTATVNMQWTPRTSWHAASM